MQEGELIPEYFPWSQEEQEIDATVSAWNPAGQFVQASTSSSVAGLFRYFPLGQGVQEEPGPEYVPVLQL